MHDDILTADKNRDWKWNRTEPGLKIKTLAEGEGETCQWKCIADFNRGRLQRDLNGGLEWWINGYSSLVTPPVGTGTQVNKRWHTYPFTPHFASICCCTLLLPTQLKEDERKRGKCLLVRLVWFGDPIWQNVFCKQRNCSLFSEDALESSIRLFAVWGGKRQGFVNKVL